MHESVAERIEAIDLTGALEEIWTLVRRANRFVEEQQPWTLAKSDRPEDIAALDDALFTLADTVRSLGVLLHPYIPAASAKILAAVGDPDNVGWQRAGLGLLEPGSRVQQPEPIFPRVDPAP